MTQAMTIQTLDLLTRYHALRATIATEVGAEQLATWEAIASEVRESPEPPPAISSALVEVDDLSDLEDVEDDDTKDEIVAARTRLTWLVRLTVCGTWVADGFNLTDERAMDMLRRDLDWAEEAELGTKVLAGPPARIVRTLQGAGKEELAELEANEAAETQLHLVREDGSPAEEIRALLQSDELRVERLRRYQADLEDLDRRAVFALIERVRSLAGMPCIDDENPLTDEDDGEDDDGEGDDGEEDDGEEDDGEEDDGEEDDGEEDDGEDDDGEEDDGEDDDGHEEDGDEPVWAKSARDEPLDAEPAIRCWPTAGVVLNGPDGPVLTIDPLDGGNVPCVHMGDVVAWARDHGYLQALDAGGSMPVPQANK